MRLNLVYISKIDDACSNKGCRIYAIFYIHKNDVDISIFTIRKLCEKYGMRVSSGKYIHPIDMDVNLGDNSAYLMVPEDKYDKIPDLVKEIRECNSNHKIELESRIKQFFKVYNMKTIDI